MCVTPMLSAGFIKEQALFLHRPEFSFRCRNRNGSSMRSAKICHVTQDRSAPRMSILPSFPYPLIHLCTFPSSIHLPIHSPPIRRFPSRPIHLAIYLPTIHLLLINLPPTHLLSIIFPFTQPPTSHHMAAIHPFTHHPNTQFWALDLKEGDRSCAALPQETVQWDKCGEP